MKATGIRVGMNLVLTGKEYFDTVYYLGPGTNARSRGVFYYFLVSGKAQGVGILLMGDTVDAPR